MRRYLYVVIMILALLLLAACGDSANNNVRDNNNNNENENNESEEVTIKLFFPWGEELFEERVGPINDRLDNINIELVEHDEGSTEGIIEAIEQLSAERNAPDIIVMGDNQLTDPYMEDIIHPLDDLIKKHDFDISLLNSNIVDTIRSIGRDGELLSFPNSNDTDILFYNKEIFDLFGIEYPTDDLTWEEVLKIAEKMSEERDGVQYRGLDIRSASRLPLDQLSVNLTDPETGEVLIEKEPAVKKYLDLVRDIYDIHGNMPEKDSDPFGGFIDETVAMTLASPQFLRWGIPEDKAEIVDFAAAPVWSDRPNQSAPAKSYYHWVISDFSEHKDEAFQVLMEYVSEETQLQLTREGQEITVLAEEEIKLQFGAELANFDGKNIAAMIAHEPATPPEQKSRFDKYVEFDLMEFVESGKDTNTYLREVAEETEVRILEADNQ